tara:strand:- start:1962 stop:2543 length:582 start_codon:yes stop_codon:yes gene_type:complete
MSERLLQNVIAKCGERKCKIYHIHGNLSEEDIHGMYNHPNIKCMVSTTHGEGFGLPLFEAAYNGMPVIAPHWSGHVDFLYKPVTKKSGKIEKQPFFEKVGYELKDVGPDAYMPGIIEKGMKWCYPKPDKYKKALRAVYSSYEIKKKRALELQEYICTTYSRENQYAKMCQAVIDTYQNDATEWKNDMEEIKVW